MVCFALGYVVAVLFFLHHFPSQFLPHICGDYSGSHGWRLAVVGCGEGGVLVWQAVCAASSENQCPNFDAIFLCLCKH